MNLHPSKLFAVAGFGLGFDGGVFDVLPLERNGQAVVLLFEPEEDMDIRQLLFEGKINGLSRIDELEGLVDVLSPCARLLEEKSGLLVLKQNFHANDVLNPFFSANLLSSGTPPDSAFLVEITTTILRCVITL